MPIKEPVKEIYISWDGVTFETLGHIDAVEIEADTLGEESNRYLLSDTRTFTGTLGAFNGKPLRIILGVALNNERRLFGLHSIRRRQIRKCIKRGWV